MPLNPNLLTSFDIVQMVSSEKNNSKLSPISQRNKLGHFSFVIVIILCCYLLPLNKLTMISVNLQIALLNVALMIQNFKLTFRH